ncbi:MAG TPA: hypothetical protein VFG23_11825 [Polyangia bacterium]|nr:hypothetical protein [Polyangia bacterium]
MKGWRGSDIPRARRSDQYAAAILVALAFAASRAFYHSKGIRLDWSTIPWFDQLLDPMLLRTRMAQSLLYLHGQPPLYNLLTGIALKLVPSRPDLVLTPIFAACGLYSAICLYVIMIRLRLPVPMAAAIASAIVASPPFILYESWYFYPHLNVTWLLGAIAWLAQSRGRPGREMAIAAAHFAGLSLTRSLFHPLFFGLVVLVILAVAARGSRRSIVGCFLIPGLLLVAWCAKNEILFGFFGTSSWASRNLSHTVETLVGRGRVQVEERRGQLTPAAGRDPFEDGDSNVVVFGLRPHSTGIPVLDNVHKQSNSFHSVSYNHWTYPASAQFYARNAQHLILAYPATYLKQLFKTSLPIFFQPVDGNGFFQANRQFIPAQAQMADDLEGSTAARWILAIGLLLAATIGINSRWTARAERVVFAVAFLTMAWVFAVGLVGELGENYRFRYNVLWLSWAIASVGYAGSIRHVGWLIDDVRQALSERRRSLSPSIGGVDSTAG